MVHRESPRLHYPDLNGSDDTNYLSIEEDVQYVDSWELRSSKLQIATAFLAGFVAAGFLFIIRETLAVSHSPSTRSTRSALPAIPATLDVTSGKPKSWFTGPCSLYSRRSKSTNCTLDLLSLSWFPAQYLSDKDHEGEQEFLGLEDWKYEHENGTIVADITAFAHDARLGDKKLPFVYTSGRWHHVHCAFMFERLQRRLSSGQVVDSYMASSGHGEHCKHIVIKAQEEWEWERKGAGVRTRVYIKYPYLL